MSDCGSVWARWQSEVPGTNIAVAIIILILCILWPGLGTVIMMFITNFSYVVDHLIVALLQFFTACIVIGWIWSIYWGILCIMKSGAGGAGGQALVSGSNNQGTVTTTTTNK